MNETTENAVPAAGKWRLELLLGALVLALPALCVRLVGMMGQYQAPAVSQVQRQQTIVVPVPARPGGIYARSRHGYVLVAGTSQVPSCYADPELIGEKNLTESAIQIAPSLNSSPVDLQNMLVLRQDRRFVWLKRELTGQEAANVTAMRVPGIGITHEWRRDYPLGQIGSCVVGFRTKDGKGGEGMELFAEKYINGQDGLRAFVADARRRPIWPIEEQSTRPRDGANVYLCLDSVIQEQLQTAVNAVNEQYKAKWAVGVVADPNTGEILAMYSTPSYDPNEYSTTPAANRTNKVIVNPYEPGSALKPVFAAVAVDMGMATWQTQINCENGVYLAPRGG
ncbi:MAG: hypothetical protein HZA50_03750, partial [Planctomycetes bacterium]|nr:hypothetical protein [Planctomycetota bacterium]